MHTLNRQERIAYVEKLEVTLPPTLKSEGRFVCWRSVPEGKGKPKKIPIDPKTKGYCSSTDRKTWADFETACRTYVDSEDLAGIGIVFTDDDPDSGIDLDRCVSDGRLVPWAEQIVRNAASYTEFSPSGTGVKIFGTGTLPGAVKYDERGIEAYCTGRYFTLTGDKLEGAPSEVRDIQHMLHALWEKFSERGGGEYGPPVDTAAILSGVPEGQRDNELWRLACKFRRADIPVDAAESLILGAASKCSPPFLADDALAKVRRAYEKYPASPDLGKNKADGNDRPGVEVLRDRMLGCVKGSICHSMGSWREYRRGVWRAVEDDCALVVASDVVEDAIPEGVRYSLPLVHQVSGSARLKLKVPNDAWDADPDRLAFINGTLDLRTFRFSEHAPEHYITAGVPYDYDPDATGPCWDIYESYLREALDSETVDFLLQYIGYCLTADTSEEKMLFLEGPRGSGKSTLVEAIEAMLGPDLCLSQSLAGLQERFGRGGIVGKRVILSREAKSLKLLETDVVSNIVSGEPVEVERKGRDGFNYRPVAKVIQAANNLPRVPNTEAGIYRRLQVVRFPHLPEECRDKAIKAGIMREGPHILNRALDGLARYRERDGLEVSERVRKASAEWRNDNDTVGMFFAECLEDGTYNIRVARIHDLYGLWCKQRSYGTLSVGEFGKRAKALDFYRTRLHTPKNVRTLYDVDLTDEGHQVNESGYKPAINYADL